MDQAGVDRCAAKPGNHQAGKSCPVIRHEEQAQYTDCYDALTQTYHLLVIEPYGDKAADCAACCDPQEKETSVSGSRNIYAAKELKLTDGISGIRTRAYSSTSLSTAPTDLFAIWHDASEVEGSGYCSLIVPSGATLRKCNGGGTSYITTFGRGL